MTEPDALSKALMRSRPELAGHVHYLGGEPWCDGVNHTTMCQPESDEYDPWMAQAGCPDPGPCVNGPSPHGRHISCQRDVD